MKRILFTTLLILLLSGPAWAQQSISVVTTIPAPDAAFGGTEDRGGIKTNSIELVPQNVNIDDTCLDNIIIRATSGENYECIGGVLQYMKGVFTQNGNNIYPTDTPNANLRFGFGTGTDTPKLKFEVQGGGIISLGTFGSGIVIPDTDVAGETKMFWYPRRAAFRAGHVAGTQWNDANIGDYSVVSGGLNGQADGIYATIGGGLNNRATGDRGTIGGGENNVIEDINAPDTGSTIGGGIGNLVRSGYATIGGGRNNTAGANGGGYNGTIGGGENNTILFQGINGTIGGGEGNSAGGTDTIAGGHNNYANSGLIVDGSSIGGGSGNRIENGVYGSTVGGGRDNNIHTTYSTIGGGHTNVIPAGGWMNTIAGGSSNTARGGTGLFDGYTFIGGGASNTTNAIYGTIAGGRGNMVSGDYAAIAGGGGSDVITTGHTASGAYSSIIGGQTSTTSGTHSAVLGGLNNTAGGAYSTASGNTNVTTGDESWVGGQGLSLDATADRTFVWGHRGAGPAINVAASDSFIVATGNVGIGNLAPTSKLHVNGTSHLDGDTVIGTTVLDADATLVVNGNIKALLNDFGVLGLPESDPLYYDIQGGTGSGEIGYDIAELFDASEEVSVGDLLVIDETKDKLHLKKSHSPYDKKVVGIASRAPAILFEGSSLEIAPPGGFSKGEKPPVALAGRVLCRVSLENGPIEPGDLLTSSSLPGYAMKATDRDRSFGATVGKALQPFRGGPNGKKEGLILIIVNLQ